MFTTANVFLATRSDGMFSMAGAMRDAALYDRVLAADRITAHFQSSRAAPRS